MNSFLLEKQQVNCNCFENSPKQASRIFRVDSGLQIKNNNKQTKQISMRNASEQGKQKKKSLKKGRQSSIHGSDKQSKSKEEFHNVIPISELHINFNSIPLKKQQKIVGFDEIHPANLMPIQLQRLKQSCNSRFQYPQFSYQSIDSSTKQQKVKFNPGEILSERIIDQKEYDKRVTQEFQKDLLEFKLAVQKNRARQIQVKLDNNKKKQFQIGHKISSQTAEQSLSFPIVRHSATQHIIPLAESQKNQLKIASFRSSAVRNCQKISIKMQKSKILPKQIESQNDSNSSTDSDQLSEVIGYGWDGATKRRSSFSEVDKKGKTEIMRMQTMATHQSQLQASHINTNAEFSNIFNSPESFYNKSKGFGCFHQQRVSGMSYQHINEMKRFKATSSKNIKHD